MDLVGIVLGIINTVVLVVLLFLILRKSIGGDVAIEPFRAEVRLSNSELRQDLSAQRSELKESLGQGHEQVEARVAAGTQAQGEELAREREARQKAHAEFREALARGLGDLTEQFHAHSKSAGAFQSESRASVEAQLAALKLENEAKLEKIRSTVDEKLQGTLTISLQANAERIQALIDSNAAKHVEMQSLLRDELDKLRQGNEAKLEKMRETVDEKLQGTLEKRLGESFSLVSQRLEQVQKGLGEMQSLASDVGGLKRVLTNVKSRGSWGEVQLSRQLEDILTADQYAENVVIRPGSRESVEFAVSLPGRDADDNVVYLPIDSKFPQEDYERLLEAQERGEKTEVDIASRNLEKAIIAQAKTISGKYIEPPYSTDFAVMYLPTEGLFAEVVRMPGLASKLQSQHRILITGPTTLMSLLNSLQVGFRSMAIEKRTSEVWKVLSAAKAEFQKYGQVWEKLEKQLQSAQNTVAQAGIRTRAVERKLRDVEATESAIFDETLSLSDSRRLEELGQELDEELEPSPSA